MRIFTNYFVGGRVAGSVHTPTAKQSLLCLTPKTLFSGGGGKLSPVTTAEQSHTIENVQSRLCVNASQSIVGMAERPRSQKTAFSGLSILKTAPQSSPTASL